MISHKVSLYAYAFLFHCGWSVWERNIFPIWLAKVTGSTVSVGVIQSVQGIIAVLSAPAIGIALDTFSRTSIKKFMFIEGLFSLGFLFFSLSFFDVDRSWILYVGMGLWGVLLSTQGTLIDTLIADFTAKGKERTKLYATKSIFWRIGGLCGQIFNLIFFYASGNSWSLKSMEKIMYVGLGITAFSLFVISCCLVTKIPTEKKKILSPTAPLLIEQIRGDERGDDETTPSRCKCFCAQPKWVIACSVLLRVFGKGIAMRLIPVYLQQSDSISPTTLTCK